MQGFISGASLTTFCIKSLPIQVYSYNSVIKLIIAICRVHKPGVPRGPASLQRLSLADECCEQRAALGLAQVPKR